MDIPKAALICIKLGFEFVAAVVGFEKACNGKSHPCVSGVVTFEKHKTDIIREYNKMMETSKKRHVEKIAKDAKKAWK